MKIGEDSVVVGNVAPDTNIGDRSVVIGPTDENGNTIINKPMAIGYGAKAGPNSIAIGAHASAGAASSPALPKTKHWYERPFGILVLGVVASLIAAAFWYYYGPR